MAKLHLAGRRLIVSISAKYSRDTLPTTSSKKAACVSHPLVVPARKVLLPGPEILEREKLVLRRCVDHRLVVDTHAAGVAVDVAQPRPRSPAKR